MLPDKRKKLIITIVSVIALVLIIIIMYNFAKFMQQRNPEEEVIIDDPYLEEYLYYGFAIDEANNYQLVGLNSEFNETMLGLRSFYPMNNLYYYNDHLVLYTDAINQINYNATDNTYTFYELNSFYSNNTDVLIAANYYVFYTANSLEYCDIVNRERTTISNQFIKGTVLLANNIIAYQTDAGIYTFNLDTLSTNEIMLNTNNSDINLITMSTKYLVINQDESYWVYYFDTENLVNISSNIANMELLEYEFVNIINDYFLYQTIDEFNNYYLKGYSLVTGDITELYNLQTEQITNSIVLEDNLLYLTLADTNQVRNVLFNSDNHIIVKNLEYNYLVLEGVN